MSRALIVLNSDRDRDLAHDLIVKAPAGTRVEFKAKRRSLPQNDKFWAMLTDIARQLTWYGHRLTTKQWKKLFMDLLSREAILVPALDGIGHVNVGRDDSSSDLTKDEFRDLLEIVAAFGAEHDVEFTVSTDSPPIVGPDGSILEKDEGYE